MTPCGHAFHRGCLDAWARKQQTAARGVVVPAATCPLCRAGLPPPAPPPAPLLPGGGACRLCLLDVLWDCLDSLLGLAGVLGAACAWALKAVLCFYAVVYAGKATLALLLLGEPDDSLVDWAPGSIHALHLVMGVVTIAILWCCCCAGACGPPP